MLSLHSGLNKVSHHITGCEEKEAGTLATKGLIRMMYEENLSY